MIVARAAGLDVGLSKDRGVLSALGVTDLGVVCVLGMTTYTPPKGGRNDLREIEADAVALALALNCPLAVDPWQAVLLAERARAQGVEVLEYSFSSDSRRKLFGRVLDLIRTGHLKCRPHDALRKELLGLEVSESAAGWRVDHRPNQHDDHVISLALAVAALAAMKFVDDITPAERARLDAFSRSWGGAPSLPAGAALAYDDAGVPIDRRFAGFAEGGLDMSGYDDGNVNTDYLEP